MRKGWFIIPGIQDGDRTIETQMEGLDKLLAEVRGKTILDAGSGEGLVSIELAKAGAKSCLGLEVVAGHVEIGNELATAAGVPCQFVQSNMNDDDITAMNQMFDIVLMLACLHKLKFPAKVCADLAGRCRDLCVIRLPPSGLKIVDLRSGNVLQDIGKTMDAAGFDLEVQGRGPFDEWIGYFRRRAGTLPAVIGFDFVYGKDQTAVAELGGVPIGVQRIWHDGELMYSKLVDDLPSEPPVSSEPESGGEDADQPRTRRNRRTGKGE